MGPALPALKDPLTGAPSPRHLRSQSPGLQDREAHIENRRIRGEVPESPLPFSSVSTHSKPDTATQPSTSSRPCSLPHRASQGGWTWLVIPIQQKRKPRAREGPLFARSNLSQLHKRIFFP